MITIFQYTFSPYPKVLRDYGSSWWEMIRFGFGTTLHFNWHGKRHIATCQCISVCSMGSVDCCFCPCKVNGYLIPFIFASAEFVAKFMSIHRKSLSVGSQWAQDSWDGGAESAEQPTRAWACMLFRCVDNPVCAITLLPPCWSWTHGRSFSRSMVVLPVCIVQLVYLHSCFFFPTPHSPVHQTIIINKYVQWISACTFCMGNASCKHMEAEIQY